MFTGTLRRAVIETLAYSDIFEFPLRLEEVHRYLPMRASQEQVQAILASGIDGRVQTKNDYYFLSGRNEIVDVRQQREAYSRNLLPQAIRYGRVLGCLPFVRMVGLTGSLAVLNVSNNIDFDYMLVTASGRLWTARAFALLFNRLTRSFGHTICPNLIVSETALEWRQKDLYSARELCQMIPVTGDAVYQRLLGANLWAREFLPNAFGEPSDSSGASISNRFTKALQTLGEFPLRGNPGDQFEHWEMKRKIARFSKQEGFGEETVFTAEICQGNFDHHRQQTEKAFQKRMSMIDTSEAIDKKVSELV